MHEPIATSVNAMNPLVTHALEIALKTLPRTLIPMAKRRFETLMQSSRLETSLSQTGAAEMDQQILISLPQVLASSDFISHALHHTPGLVETLLDTDCVLQPRKLEDIGIRVANCWAPNDTVDKLMSTLRDIRKR